MRAPLVAALLVLAGCAAPAGDAPEGVAFVLSRVADAGSEPTVGATASGAIFVGGARAPAQGPGSGNVGREAVYRSTDDGASWTNVLTAPDRSPADFDPWLWVDPDTDRVYNAPLYVGCSWLSWSDDEGATWSSNPRGGCGTPGHDHQHLTGGPPASGVATSGYPSVLYYAYASLRPGTSPVLNATNPVFGSNVYEGSAVSVSLDGGASWAAPVIARGQDPCTGANDGAVAVARDGTAYLGMPTCQGVDVVVSHDSGSTWETPVHVGGVGSQLGIAMDPALAVEASGRAHLAFIGADNVVYHATSEDRGASWSAPSRVQSPEVRASVFPAMVAGGSGLVAFAYLGTSSDPSTWASFDPSDAPDDAVWHVYVTWRGPGGSVVAQVTPEEDPVQRGCIWLRGGSHPCRNLGDFIGLAALPDGRVVVAYADGCDACTAAADERPSHVYAAIQTRGPTLE